MFSNRYLFLRYFCAKHPLRDYQFLNATSANYIEKMHNLWQEDSTKVHASWDIFFKTGVYTSPPGIAPTNREIDKYTAHAPEISTEKASETVPQTSTKTSTKPPSEPTVSQTPKESPKIAQPELEINPQTTKESSEPAPSEQEIFPPIPIDEEPNLQKPTVIQTKPQTETDTTPIIDKPIAPAATEDTGVSEKWLNISEVTDVEEHNELSIMAHCYQNYGHYLATIDPLKIENKEKKNLYKKQTLQKLNGCISKLGSLDKVFSLPKTTAIADEGGDIRKLPLAEIIKRFEETYCRNIGFQCLHSNNIAFKKWMQRRVETPGERVTKLEKQIAIRRLLKATMFEQFITKKWPGDRQFSLEGCESFIPAMGQIIDSSSLLGVDRVIMGMGNRGRLNVIANIIKKPARHIFTAFQGMDEKQIGSGDVKYQLGTSNEFLNLTSHKSVRVSICSNPAHLESVGPVVAGKAKAKMFHRGDTEGNTCLPILIHGDGAFSGLGVCFETIHLSQLPMYTTYGTIHVVINNQIALSTNPENLSSCVYCTGIGRVVDAPIIHVNADDVENVIYAAKIAAEYRAHFHGDVVLDIVGYRRHGILDTEDPSFTQPFMYNKIRETPPVLEKFYKEMVSDHLITETDYQTIEHAYEKTLNDEFTKSLNETIIQPKHWLESSWAGFFEGRDLLHCSPTGISESTIMHIGKVFSSPPPDKKFMVHPGITRILKHRKSMLDERLIDFALAEAIAFGSLLKDGHHVRLSGQDVERGTFGHRHHVIHHQKNEKAQYRPLTNLYPDQAIYTVSNSSLSEYGVMGFELGYSLISPNDLVIWEAQFGDFANNAQVIFDQCIAAGERRWIRQTGMVLLLPHGMEGQGSEHSSARPERYLMSSNDDPDDIPDLNDELFSIKQLLNCNIIVANMTTPANYFHALRRQILLPFRKPLIVFAPKVLLRLPTARSSIDHIVENTEFQRVLIEEGPSTDNPENVEKLLFCSGKVYYDLTTARHEKNLTDKIAIVRVEQLSPFPYDLIKKELKKFEKVQTVAWVQEENRNIGPWYYVEPRFQFLGVGNLNYIGRSSDAVPASGYISRDHADKKQFLEEAMII